MKKNNSDKDSFSLNPDNDQKSLSEQQLKVDQPNAKHAHRLVYLYLILLLIAALTGVCGVIYHHAHLPKKIVNKVLSSSSAETVKTKPKTNTSSTYQFFSQPKQLQNLNFFSNTENLFGTNCANGQTTDCPPNVSNSQISYAQIGLTPQEQPIVVAYDYSAAENSFYFVAVETSTNQYQIMGNLSSDSQLNSQIPSDQSTISNLKGNLSSNVTLDTTDSISALQFPQSAVIKNLGIGLLGRLYGSLGYFMPSLNDIRGSFYGTVNTSQISKLGMVGNITFYEVNVENQPSYSVKEIYGVIGGVFAAEYTPSDPLILTSYENYPAIQFVDGSSNSKQYVSTGFGCGSADGYVVAAGLNQSQLTYAGAGPNEEPIYQLLPSSSVFKALYNGNYSIARFQSDHALIVAKNGLGEYEVYERADMFEFGGCGKPVIYLYPQKTTHVNVEVGAHITASNPPYPTSGWQNIVAHPDGSLSYNGITYPYLYWEGKGDGEYPLVTNGTVVKKSQAIPMIMKQLAEQGINNSEAHSFIAYWGPKLPNTPYIRLSWLNTKQMNELAPLVIVPRPQTLIRVFLDFEGLNYPISINPQKFSDPPRDGFTVVEWGGLLH